MIQNGHPDDADCVSVMGIMASSKLRLQVASSQLIPLYCATAIFDNSSVYSSSALGCRLLTLARLTVHLQRPTQLENTRIRLAV